MKSPPVFIFKEHSFQLNTDEQNLAYLLSDKIKSYNFSPENLTYLGIDEKLKANYFIGMTWIKWSTPQGIDKGIIWIQPKHENINFEQLLWLCLQHPLVSDHLEKCYTIFPDETPIPVPKEFENFITPLLITDFLVRVQKIIKKGLKRGFVKTRNILTGKIKGKIHIHQTLMDQLKKNNLTNNYCSYQIHTIDCPENRILKSALLQCQKYVYKFVAGSKKLKELLHYNVTAFLKVKPVSINPYNFYTSNYCLFYKEYKTALILAKCILKTLGFSIDSNISNKDNTILPFYINMPELFERYCEVLLRKKYPDTLAGYQYHGYSETRSGQSRLRPDFIIPSENMIVESKYKYWIEKGEDFEGIKQLCLYSRHKKIVERLKQNRKLPKLQFIYPSSEGKKEIDFESKINNKIDEFIELYKFPLNII